MKTLQSYQEAGHVIDSCNPVVFTCHPEVRVSVLQENPLTGVVKVKLFINVGNTIVGHTTVGIAENEYASIDDVLEAFQINDIDEIWEVLD